MEIILKAWYAAAQISFLFLPRPLGGSSKSCVHFFASTSHYTAMSLMCEINHSDSDWGCPVLFVVVYKLPEAITLFPWKLLDFSKSLGLSRLKFCRICGDWSCLCRCLSLPYSWQSLCSDPFTADTDSCIPTTTVNPFQVLSVENLKIKCIQIVALFPFFSLLCTT